MYNQELKERFLEQYDKKSAKIYRNSLLQINDTEQHYNKDVFNFTYEQLDEAFKGIRAKTLAGVRRIVTPITMYIDWANQQGYVKSKIAYTTLFSGEKLEDYIWSYALNNSYITRQELFDLCSDLINPIDAVMLALIFEGIDGKEHYEIRNLKKTDINFSTGEIKVTNIKKESRIVTITDLRTLGLLKEAIDETIYIGGNGNAREREDILDNTPYILRRVDRGYLPELPDDNMITSSLVSNKATRFFKGTKNSNGMFVDYPFLADCEFLNLSNIFKSGYFDYCMQLEEEKGAELKIIDYKKACVRYGINPNLASSYKKQYTDWKNR